MSFLAISPVFTNDAITLGILLIVLALIFHTEHLKTPFWKKFYTYVPGLLLAYFIPALLNWPLGLISPHWYSDGLMDVLAQKNLTLPSGLSYDGINDFLDTNGVAASEYKPLQRHSQLYLSLIHI